MSGERAKRKRLALNLAARQRKRAIANATEDFLRQAKRLLDPELFARVKEETLRSRSSIPNPRAEEERAAQPATADDFVSASAAAKALGLSLDTVKRRVSTGLLRGYTDPADGSVYVQRASVLEALQTRDTLRASAGLPGAEPPRLPDEHEDLG